MNAIEILIKDHRDVEAVFEEIESAASASKFELFLKVKDLLEPHAHIEENVFYPTMQRKEDPDLVELVAKALADHTKAKAFLGEISAADSNSDEFEGLLAQLVEDTRRHIEEEETEMFTMAEEHFDPAALDTIGAQMEDEKISFRSSSESIHNS